MKSLQSIQKTFRVFQILVKIAFVLSVVGASICAAGALCSAVWYSGGQVFGLFGEPITLYIAREDMSQTMAVLLSNLVRLTTDAILLTFAGRYLKTEQTEGTPFTENGANLLKKLGIRCIWMPIAAIVLAFVITVCMGVEENGDVSNYPGVVIGIVLILNSLIFRYGAELEGQARLPIPDGEK